MKRTRGWPARLAGAFVLCVAMVAALVTARRARGQTPPGALPATAPSGSASASATPTTMPPTYRATPPPNAPAVVRRSSRSGHVRLDYQLGKGSRTCDSEALFRQIFASELREPDPFVLIGPVEAVATVRLERDPPGFRGTVELRDLQGAILVRAETVERTCADAADRLMIELLVQVFPAPPPPAPAPPPPPEAAPGIPPEALVKVISELRGRLDAQEEKNEEQEEKIRALERALAEERKRKMDLTFALSAGALMTANLTSNVGPGVWLGGDVRTGPISLGLEARAVLPAPVFLAPYDFDVSQVVALLTPCGRYSVFFGCAVAGAGVEIHHDPNTGGLTGPETASGPVLQIGGRLGAEYFFGDSPFGARAWGEVSYAAPHAGQVYHRADGSGALRWSRPDVSAFFGLGVVVRFGGDSTSQGVR